MAKKLNGGTRVVVVNANGNLGYALREALESFGATVTTFEHGSSAKDKILCGVDFDLAICDHPSNTDLIDWLAVNAPETPVILTSIDSDDSSLHPLFLRTVSTWDSLFHIVAQAIPDKIQGVEAEVA